MTILKSSVWRSKFRVHPVADLFPMMSDKELAETGADIKANELREPIAVRRIYPPDAKGGVSTDRHVLEVLDGRNRLEAMERAGIKPPAKAFGEMDLDDAEAVAYIISANIHRRHLTPEQKKRITDNLLKDNPAQSDRQVAKVAKVDHKTVAAHRAKLEATGEIPQLDKRKGADGKARPVKGAKAKGAKEPAPKETARAPLRRKPSLETQHIGVIKARRLHVDEAVNVGVDVETEVELFADELRKAARKRGGNGAANIDAERKSF